MIRAHGICTRAPDGNACGGLGGRPGAAEPAGDPAAAVDPAADAAEDNGTPANDDNSVGSTAPPP
ncbi:hypothetical protein ACFQ9X_33890 [Catenulispora yoronensis]